MKLQTKIIKNIEKMFKNNWEYFELGSSQTDLIESYVKKTIQDTFKEQAG